MIAIFYEEGGGRLHLQSPWNQLWIEINQAGLLHKKLPNSSDWILPRLEVTLRRTMSYIAIQEKYRTSF